MSEYPARYRDVVPQSRLELLRMIVDLERQAWEIVQKMRGLGDASELDDVRQASIVRRAELELVDEEQRKTRTAPTPLRPSIKAEDPRHRENGP